MVQNIFTNGRKLLVYFSIGIASNYYPLRLQITVSFRICRRTLLFIVLRAVKLYRKMRFCDIEIQNIVTEYFLPVNRIWKSPQKVKP